MDLHCRGGFHRFTEQRAEQTPNDKQLQPLPFFLTTCRERLKRLLCLLRFRKSLLLVLAGARRHAFTGQFLDQLSRLV